MMAKILFLDRFRRSNFGTFGELCLADDDDLLKRVHLCYTLEPAVCDNHTNQGVYCGRYNMYVTYSPAFRRDLPLLEVHGRSGIRVHAGNTVDDTRGCILVGVEDCGHRIHASKVALDYVLAVIKSYGVRSISIQDNLFLPF